jgi:hypothetical protein
MLGPSMAKESGDSDGAMSLVKGGLLALGGITAVLLLFAMLKPLMIIGVLGLAGYIGYRVLAQPKALEAGKGGPKAITSDADFERRMRELEAAERKLDAEIRRNS